MTGNNGWVSKWVRGDGEDGKEGGVGGKRDPYESKYRPIQKSKSPVAVPRAPIKIVDGHCWSPGIYRAQRLLGKTLKVAWEGAFVRALTLIIISDY